MQSPAIRTENLTKIFRRDVGKKPVTGLDGLDLEVRQGEVFAFLGPNGAGKSTTIKLLTRLLRPSRGRVEIFGQPGTDRLSMKDVGYMPEQPNLYDHQTAREFLDFAARLYGMDSKDRKNRTGLLLEKVGMAPEADRSLRTFSRGMVQRIALAQSLIHDPRLVILDEPMASLDPKGRKDVRDLILDLRSAGKTVFFSSHILSDAEVVSDRVGILNRGRLVFVGSPDHGVDRPMLGVEIRFSWPADAAPDPKWKGKTLICPDGRNLVRVEDERKAGVLLRTVLDAGGIIHSVVPLKRTLEDVFMDEIER
jgi:ABC-2 type transport system ATP-binding protein